MKSRISKLLMGVIACLTVIMMFNVKANAANASISVSSASGSVGDTVSVDVTVKPEGAALAQIAVSYDTNYLEYAGGGNGGEAGIVMDALDISEGSTGTTTIKFKLKKAGTTTVSISSASTRVKAADPENANMNISKTDGSVAINAASSASADSHLSGLVVQAVTQSGDSTTVSYSPSFSPDVYEYRADLAANTSKLVIATTLSDSNATTKVSGTRIDPGDNKTTITVVAENGSQSQYILYTTRASEGTTETTSEGQSEETTTDFDRSPKLISSISKYLIQDFSLVSIPEGFEESTSTYNGETIAVLKGISKELTLMCLADDAQGTNLGIFIYNEASGAIDKMINITSAQKMYTIIPTDETYAGPEGYTKTTLEINGETVTAWIKAADSQFYIVYAMNWDGEKALYVYDTKEQTMQRFVEGNKSESFTDEPKEENKEYLAMKKQYNDMYDEYVNDHSKKNKIIIGLGIIVICALIAIALLGYKIRGTHSDNEDSDDDEDMEEIGSEQGSKELKLDMVEQVNEMKAEKLAAQVHEMMNEEDSETDEITEVNDNIQSEENEQEYMQTKELEEGLTEAETGELEENPFEIEFVDLNDGNDKK